MSLTPNLNHQNAERQ